MTRVVDSKGDSVSLGEAATSAMNIAERLRPVLKGKRNRTRLHLTSLAIRNSLFNTLKSFNDQFPSFADQWLLIQQSEWHEYEITDQDNELSTAYKLISNILLKVHKANMMHKNVTRHLELPFSEMIQLARLKGTFRYLFNEDQVAELLQSLDEYFPSFSQVWARLTATEPELQPFTLQEDYFPKPAREKEAADTEPSAKTLLAEIGSFAEHLKKDIGLISEAPAQEILEALTTVVKFFENGGLENPLSSFKSLLSSTDLIKKVLTRYMQFQPLITIQLQEDSAARKLIKFINDLFIYLDAVESRLGINGYFTNILNDKIRELAAIPEQLAKTSGSSFIDLAGWREFFNTNLGVKNGIFCRDARVSAAAARINKCRQLITTLTPNDTLLCFNVVCEALYFGGTLPENFEVIFTDSKHVQMIKNYLGKNSLPTAETKLDEFIGKIQDFAGHKKSSERVTTFDFGSLAPSDKRAIFKVIDHFGKIGNQVRGIKILKVNSTKGIALIDEIPPGRDPHEIKVTFTAIRRELTYVSAAVMKVQEDMSEMKVLPELAGKFAGSKLLVNHFLRQLTDLMQLYVELAARIMDPAHPNTDALVLTIAEQYCVINKCYEQLTEVIPLTCRSFLQMHFIEFAHQNGYLIHQIPGLKLQEQIDQYTREADLSLNNYAVADLKLLLNPAKLFQQEVKAVPVASLVPPPSGMLSRVSAAWSGIRAYTIGPSQAALDDQKQTVADFKGHTDELIEYLGEVESIINELKAELEKGTKTTQCHGLANRLADRVFRIQYLGSVINTKVNPSLTAAWNEFNKQIADLRSRNQFIDRAFPPSADARALETDEWRAKLGISDPLPALVPAAEMNLIDLAHEQVNRIRSSISKLMANQPEDSPWRRFRDAETTETAYLAEFMDLLDKVSAATDPSISDSLRSRFIPGIEWLTRLSHFTPKEHIVLMDKITAFVFGSDIAQFRQEMTDLFAPAAAQLSALVQKKPGEVARNILETVANPAATRPEKFIGSFLQSGVVSARAAQLLHVLGNLSKIQVNQKQMVDKAPDLKWVPEPMSYVLDYNVRDVRKNYGTIAMGFLFIGHGCKALAAGVVNLTRRGVFHSRIKHNKKVLQQHEEHIREAKKQLRTTPSLSEITRNNPAIPAVTQNIRDTVVLLDSAAVQVGLVEGRKLLSGVTEAVVDRARELDPNNSVLAREWKIMGGEPFLMERLEAQMQQLKDLDDEIKALEGQIPPAVHRMIAWIRDNAKFQKKENLPDFSGDLTYYGPEIVAYLKTHTSINHKELDNLIYSVRNLALENPFDTQQLSFEELQAIARKIEQHIKEHSRKINSAKFKRKNLQASIDVKKKALVLHYHRQLETLQAQGMHLKLYNKKPENLEKFAASYQKFTEDYVVVAEKHPEFIPPTVRAQVKKVSSVFQQLAKKSEPMQAAASQAQELVVKEIKHGVGGILTTLTQLQSRQKTQLLSGLEQALIHLQATSIRVPVDPAALRMANKKVALYFVKAEQVHLELAPALQQLLRLMPELKQMVKQKSAVSKILEIASKQKQTHVVIALKQTMLRFEQMILDASVTDHMLLKTYKNFVSYLIKIKDSHSQLVEPMLEFARLIPALDEAVNEALNKPQVVAEPPVDAAPKLSDKPSIWTSSSRSEEKAAEPAKDATSTLVI